MMPAVFIDKDGTLVHDVPHNVAVERIVLRAGAGAALARLRRAGFALVLVSNQPGVGLGLFADAALAAVWAHLRATLAADAVALDAFYYCPHAPVAGRDHEKPPGCICRKPAPGLLLRAAAEHGYDLARSWMIGDILDDVEAGQRSGCRTVLLDVGSETEWRRGLLRRPDVTVPDLAAAATAILARQQHTGGGNAGARQS